MNQKELLSNLEAEFDFIEKALELAKKEGKKTINLSEYKKWYCGECQEIRVGDERIEAGLKCSRCAGY